jgi:hypothetical protein
MVWRGEVSPECACFNFYSRAYGVHHGFPLQSLFKKSAQIEIGAESSLKSIDVHTYIHTYAHTVQVTDFTDTDSDFSG